MAGSHGRIESDDHDHDENVRLRRGSRLRRRSSSRTRIRRAGSAGKIRPLFFLVALVSLAWSLYQLPLNRVVERRLCGEYYRGRGGTERDGEIPEERCKVDEVQRGLGRVQGVMETGWVVGDFVMTIPMIAIADRYGHGYVLLVNLVPRVILLGWTFAVGYFDGVLPVNAIMVAPLFSVLGGDCVFNSIVYSLVSSSTDDVIQRATFFGQMNAISSVFAYQLGPALASASMSVSLWLPFWFGIILLVLAVPVVSVLDLGFPGKQSRKHQDIQRDVEHEEGTEGAPLLSQATPDTKQHHSFEISEFTQSIRKRFYALTDIVTSYPLNFTLLLAGFFLTSLASSDTKLLTQYISKRYQWKFTSVGYLLSGKAVFNFFLLYFIIPALLRWRRRPRPSSPLGSDQERQQHRDGAPPDNDQSTITHAHICLVFSVLGAMAIGLSSTIWLLVPSLLLYALGIALPMFTYSLLKSPAMLPPSRTGGTPKPDEDEEYMDQGERGEGQSNRQRQGDMTNSEDAALPTPMVPSAPATGAQLFSIVMLVKTSGMLVGAPLMATLWVHGVGVGGAALGLPYFVSAVCYGLVILIFMKIRV